MLVHEVHITEKDIEYAERILLKEGQSFDEERRAFIKDLTTLDLQAVPGSGKTTALLAKLLILEKYLPSDDGSGVLILSHTNTAVDEIKNRIGQFCPKLFSYPNFIGTIQSFINKYLVLPFYKNHFEMKLHHIDTEIYESMLISEFEKVKWNNPPKLGAWLYMQNGKDNEKVEKVIKNIYYDFEHSEVKDINTNKPLIKSENPKHDLLKIIINNVLLSGTMSYAYAYKFANYYINDFSKIIGILRKRFSIVFIDEMQDMDKYQYDLLERLFYNDGSTTIFQRIGDKNQAIYHGGDIETDTIWQDREKVLKLTGSNRLSKYIAQLVQNFGMECIEIEALQNHAEDLKPHILIYDDDNINTVIPRYSQLLKTYLEEKKLPHDSKHPFKAISWRKEHETKTALKDYYDKFEENYHKIKESYSNLKSYLIYFEDKNNNFRGIRKNILHALLQILRLENIKDENDKFYTKTSLINFLQTEQVVEENTIFDEFNIKIFQWCKLIITQNCVGDVYVDIKNFIPTFLEMFDVTINKSRTFINNEHIGTCPEPTASNEIKNIYDEDGFDIHISTVHSVKGETHTSTLYLESFYRSKYESERHVDQFNFNRFASDKKYDKQSVKIAYVGFSRPTHLLCIAIHKDRVDDIVKESGTFEIIDLGS